MEMSWLVIEESSTTFRPGPVTSKYTGLVVRTCVQVWGHPRSGKVKGDIDAGFGDVKIEGPVEGDVRAEFGDVYVNAPVRGT